MKKDLFFSNFFTLRNFFTFFTDFSPQSVAQVRVWVAGLGGGRGNPTTHGVWAAGTRTEPSAADLKTPWVTPTPQVPRKAVYIPVVILPEDGGYARTPRVIGLFGEVKNAK